METLWAGLTEGQGAVLSSLITVLAAGLGILLGWVLFSGRVLNLKDAIDRSEKMLESYRADMDRTLDKLSADLQSFQRLTQESLNQVSLSVDDLQSSARPANLAPSQDAAAQDEIEGRREEIRRNWYPIRDHIEHLATSPELDPQLRDRYARMDRRSYMPFVEQLGKDGVFGEASSLYLQAARLWQLHRSGRSFPASIDVEEMRHLNEELVRN